MYKSSNDIINKLSGGFPGVTLMFFIIDNLSTTNVARETIGKHDNKLFALKQKIISRVSNVKRVLSA